ncbi:uncharacterized protein LOC143303495 isoform X2 [Bombus vancouverensis nearcticus]|uniref:uncharacterized protein LOC143303495 isoform X2 n=1 Tax=Bombus vancouverensis nearcticus TaxID=2705178 RepID=UPI00402BE7B2
MSSRSITESRIATSVKLLHILIHCQYIPLKTRARNHQLVLLPLKSNNSSTYEHQAGINIKIPSLKLSRAAERTQLHPYHGNCLSL